MEVEERETQTGPAAELATGPAPGSSDSEEEEAMEVSNKLSSVATGLQLVWHSQSTGTHRYTSPQSRKPETQRQRSISAEKMCRCCSKRFCKEHGTIADAC